MEDYSDIRPLRTGYKYARYIRSMRWRTIQPLELVYETGAVPNDLLKYTGIAVLHEYWKKLKQQLKRASPGSRAFSGVKGIWYALYTPGTGTWYKRGLFRSPAFAYGEYSQKVLISTKRRTLLEGWLPGILLILNCCCMISGCTYIWNNSNKFSRKRHGNRDNCYVPQIMRNQEGVSPKDEAMVGLAIWEKGSVRGVFDLKIPRRGLHFGIVVRN